MKMKLEAAIKSLTDSVKNKDWAYGPAVQSVLDALSATEKDSGELEQSLNVANAATQAWKQRAKAAEASVGVLEGIIARKEFDSQKGEQAPYGFIDPNAETGGMWVKNRAREGDQFAAPIFTVPQKPIISKEKLCDWLEDNFDIDDSQRDAFAQCFAHNCECVVKQEGE